MIEKYCNFLKELDLRLNSYINLHKSYIQCKKGCSLCCQKGDYPISELELKYLMQGFIKLENSQKQIIQNNVKNMQKGEACPFLVDNLCSLYEYRPIICRVHGLAYLCKADTVKLPYCANIGKNYAEVYQNGEVTLSPIKENLNTPNILKDFDYGEIRNLYDWLK